VISLSGLPIGSAINSPLLEKLNLANERLLNRDSLLWGESAETEAVNRLGWIELHTKSTQLLPKFDAIAALRRKNSINRIVLCGMGGSSLAPEVIAASNLESELPLIILDSTDPADLIPILESDLSKTLFVFASKSGSTIETNSHRALFHAELIEQKLEIRDHLLVITDPDSALEIWAKDHGVQVLNGFADVGGRFSALSAFGLAPAAICGIDVSILLDEAHDVALELAKPSNPAVLLALAIFQSGSSFISLPDLPLSQWVEQLIAESTGKEGKGVLPIIEGKQSKNSDAIRIVFDSSTGNNQNNDVYLTTSLGGQFLFWEWTTALLCYLIEVNPFDQPNVTLAKERANSVLAEKNISIVETSVTQVQALLKDFILKIEPIGYLGILAFLPRSFEVQINELEGELRNRFDFPITVGWGPRYLHSTGQFHKGGVPTGSFLILTHEVEEDLEIPGQSYSFAQLQKAQALGDVAALIESKLNVLNLTLTKDLTLNRINQSLREVF
jgi:glucose-6-phosphate isomerase